MAVLDIKKLTADPGIYAPNTLYFIAPTGSPSELQIILSSNDDSTARHVITKAEVQALITSAMQSFNYIQYAADITVRDALILSSNTMVYVADATGDPTVNLGAALYFYKADSNQFIKVAEYESMDLMVTWNSIQGKPTSSPSAIDTAVANSHVHANKTQLDKIDQDADGNLTYNGNYIKAALTVVQW
jgi:hypothetical protein